MLEKILEEIEAHAIEFETFGVSDDYISVGWVKDIIRRHINNENLVGGVDRSRSIDESRTRGWIPVEERLPEGGEEVLVQGEFYSRRNNMTYTHIHIMRLNKMTGEWDGVYGVPNGKVIAWKPLSEPYIPEEIETRKELERSEGE